MKSRTRFVVIVAKLCAAITAVEPATWRVVNVHDGDTITALEDAHVERKIRLHGIDAAELGQPFGRERLAEFVKGETPAIHQHGKDRYGRVLAGVELKHHDVAHELAADALAGF